MSRKKRFIKLSESEILTLKEGHKNGVQYQFRDRCQCLILSNQGQDSNQLSAIFKVSLLTIYNWFNRWELNGIAGLMNSPGQGRKVKLSLDNEHHVEVLEQLVEANYQDVERIRNELEKKFNLTLSKDTVRRYLKKITFDGVAFDVVQKKDKIQWPMLKK